MYGTVYNRSVMRLIVILLLLCPLAVSAAEWRYEGQMSPSPAETAAAEPAGDMSPLESLGGDVPVNNMTMSVVRSEFGDPETVLDAVGEPPITRWQYPDYVVYFEHDQVIISVAGRL